MPIDLKSLQKRGAEITVEYYGMESTIGYLPTKFTPAYRSEYNAQMRKQAEERRAALEKAVKDAREGKGNAAPVPAELARGNVRLLCDMVTEWDIVGLDGKPLPVEEEAILEALPDALVAHIISEVWADVNNLGKSRKNDSS